MVCVCVCDVRPYVRKACKVCNMHAGSHARVTYMRMYVRLLTQAHPSIGPNSYMYVCLCFLPVRLYVRRRVRACVLTCVCACVRLCVLAHTEVCACVSAYAGLHMHPCGFMFVGMLVAHVHLCGGAAVSVFFGLLVQPFMRSLVHLLAYYDIRWFVRSPVCSLARYFVRWFICSCLACLVDCLDC